jgi:hypothetical protein
MKTIIIYCEGTKRSHDYDILHKIIGDTAAVIIQPIGGLKGANEAIQAFESAADKADVSLLFRDRDFDVPVPDKPSLTIKDNVYYSYRTTIENYLLDANCFFLFLQEHKLYKQYKMHSVAAVQNVFIKAAKRISYYQALRHTIAEMRPSDDCKTTWIKGNSGSLPDTLKDAIACRQKAFDYLKATNTTPQYQTTKAAFDTVLNKFYERFEQDAFYNNSDYLIWFQGKDFAKSLSLLLPQCPMAHYYRFAKKYFDYTQFKDLVEFKKIIDSHSNTT